MHTYEIQSAWPAPAGTRVAFADPQDPSGVELRMTKFECIAWAVVFDHNRGHRVVPLIFDEVLGMGIDATASALFLGVHYSGEESKDADRRFARRYFALRAAGVLDDAKEKLYPTVTPPPNRVGSSREPTDATEEVIVDL